MPSVPNTPIKLGELDTEDIYCIHATGSVSITSANTAAGASIPAGAVVSRLLDVKGTVLRTTSSNSRQYWTIGTSYTSSGSALQFNSGVYFSSGASALNLNIFASNAMTATYDLYIYYTIAKSN